MGGVGIAHYLIAPYRSEPFWWDFGTRNFLKQQESCGESQFLAVRDIKKAFLLTAAVKPLKNGILNFRSRDYYVMFRHYILLFHWSRWLSRHVPETFYWLIKGSRDNLTN